MKLGIVTPVWISQKQEILTRTLEYLASLSTFHDARVYLVTTRLDLISAAELQALAIRACRYPVTVMHETKYSRSVAEAWNAGLSLAFEDKCDLALIAANDIEVHAETLNDLITFGVENPDIALWSGIDTSKPKTKDITETCDFSCVMLRPSTIARFGTFDEFFKPAYFEDNDYYTRVIVGGGLTRQVGSARFVHHGSYTVKVEPEAAHHVSHWWELNRARYGAKWGPLDPPGTPAGVRAACFRHPWNDPSLHVAFWRRD